MSLQTPFLKKIWLSFEFSMILPFFDHRMLGAGSDCTIHSNLAVWPLTTAMSRRGYANSSLDSNIAVKLLTYRYEHRRPFDHRVLGVLLPRCTPGCAGTTGRCLHASGVVKSCKRTKRWRIFRWRFLEAFVIWKTHKAFSRCDEVGRKMRCQTEWFLWFLSICLQNMFGKCF